MAIELVGYANRFVTGEWSVVFPDQASARQHARAVRDVLHRTDVVVPLYRDVPDVPVRPEVLLVANGERVRYRVSRRQWVVNAEGKNTSVDSVVAIVRGWVVSDAELDALQALPAQTAAWVAAGGVD